MMLHQQRGGKPRFHGQCEADRHDGRPWDGCI